MTQPAAIRLLGPARCRVSKPTQILLLEALRNIGDETKGDILQ